MRHRLIGSLFFCLLSAAIFAAKFSANISSLHVNESATRFLLQKEGATVSLAVENPQAVATTVRITLELIDPREAIRGKAAIDKSIQPGPSFLSIPLFKAGTFDYDKRELIWYRLRYKIEPAGANEPVAKSATVSGVISLSEITPDVFRLQVSALQEAGKDLKYAIRARTIHPLTGRPVSGVKAQALMIYEEDDDERSSKAAGVTNSTGEALLEFKLKSSLKAEYVRIKVSAESNGFYQEAEEEVRIFYPNHVIVSTDKPLYQPGQTLHIRVLGFDHDRKALAETDGTLKVRDPEDNIIFRSAIKTSRFGVASVDWPIPDNVRLGEYLVDVWFGEEGPNNSPGFSVFKISRYDLPNFVVNVKPDRSYYLPGQNAEVEVRADYLFGQPVKRGRVRVVRETDRKWNYREQKWETSEGNHYEGELDDQGRFIARIKLEEEHEDFKPGRYSLFRDLRYAAYLTDPTTGRTEQRRFDLRITRDQIHVYLIERGRAGEGMPLQFYISTSYADGTPVQCEVAISRLLYAGTDAGKNRPADSSVRPKLTIKTNRYGVAKVAAFDAGRAERYGHVSLELSARDDQGRSGRDVYDFWNYDSIATRVETDRTLYRPGEPIKARVTSNSTYTNWIIDLIRGSRLLATRTAQMKDGRIEIAFPFATEFTDDLTVIAYPALSDEDAHSLTGMAMVLYPRERELKLDVTLNRPSYRPGDEAILDLRVLTAGGRAAESALGVVVFDKAVEERARTDREFSGRSFGFYEYFKGLMGDGESLAGITRRDLDHIDLSKLLPEGLELVAEILLNQRHYGYYQRSFSSGDFTTDGEEVFRALVSEQVKPVDSALDWQYRQKSVYPVDETTWRRQMLLAGVELDSLRDPWGVPYRVGFSVKMVHDQFELVSAGPDKRFDTEDDFTALKKSWLYFHHTSAAIERAIENYHARTGVFIRDRETLRRELMLYESLDIDLLRDRWRKSYRFEFGVDGRNFFIRARSGGPNGQFEDAPDSRGRESDDFIVSSCYIDYTAEFRARIKRALSAYFKRTGTIPQDDRELHEALKRSGIDFAGMRDGWDHGYYATFKVSSRYSNRMTIFDQAQYGEKMKSKTEITPVTQQLAHVTVRSAGGDGKEGTFDDFDVVEFSHVIAEESAKELAEKSIAPTKPQTLSYPWDGRAIAGTVKDASGAALVNATVAARHIDSEAIWTAKTDDQGNYMLSNIPPGIYEVRFDAVGFKSAVITNVSVFSSKSIKLDATLEPGAVAETVAVTAESPAILMTENATVGRNSPAVIPGASRIRQLSTPRLREYFPETLLWQPQLETDRRGRANLRFKLADNITTWKLSVVGSTADGEIGIAEKEFTAFQPFFAEHDPPKVLTEGDEIALPVVLRNYLERTQSVNAEIKPESWFELLSPGRKQVEVKPGDAGNVIFDFRAVSSIKDGKQRITVFGSDASDAIEKPVGVHPDGEELAGIASTVFTDNGLLEIVVPEAAIRGSVRAELKIYPNLMAHALEGIEGILQRPYGCAEQTISSTYPNIMILRYLEPQGELISAPMRKVAERARRYARMGYEKLLGYRGENGGFAYWGRGDANTALTAYALRFLNDARAFIQVDEEVIEGARKFLIGQQQTDGRWTHRYWGREEDAKRTSLNTAFIARVLAMERAMGGKSPAGDKTLAAAVSHALDHLAKRIEEIDEPYLIASYALAAFDAGEKAGAGRAVAKLRALAREESGATYWSLESNTPFYGWGLAGRIETTALAVRALKRAEALDGKQAGERSGEAALTDRGLLFLLRNKDRYGVWLSTQATINVLDTLISLNEGEAWKSGPSGKAEIFVNGKRAGSVAMPPGGQLSNPLTVDLSPFLDRGRNRVEIRRAEGVVRSSAQIIETHYEPWERRAGERREDVALRNSSALKLGINYDRTGAKIGEEVTCRVTAERTGDHGYGMMLAEIGLPPGADVDRESLERAAKGSNWSINHYDVLPDRVIFYLWPPAGGVRFDFRFRARYGIKAKTAPSVLYDYYNPEARAVVAPTQFVVR
jgi:A-macroglobulin TED domain/Alpha-2-macroglobulin family/Carboxypeptidase regulatory-like domain/MG2 domain/A-macroglobulin receptor binding domain/Macroglobulin domain MG3